MIHLNRFKALSMTTASSESGFTFHLIKFRIETNDEDLANNNWILFSRMKNLTKNLGLKRYSKAYVYIF